MSKIGIIIIFRLSRKRKRGAHYFLSNPFLPPEVLLSIFWNNIECTKVVPKGDRGPKGNTLRVYPANTIDRLVVTSSFQMAAT